MWKIFFLLTVALLFATVLYADDIDGTLNGYTPYSVYGVGDLSSPGNAFSNSMGGVGVALRSKRYMNFHNPASVTARDSLSFMADFSVSGRLSYFRQNDIKSAHSTFNINNFAISFPIWRSSAMMIGIAPFSNVGYDFSTETTDPERLALQGGSQTVASGDGGIYQAFVGGGVTFWKRLSIGAQYIFYFGGMDRTVQINYDDTNMLDQESGYIVQTRAHSAKFGLQYEQPIGKRSNLIMGATYRLKANMRGHLIDYSFASDGTAIDTLRYNNYDLHKEGKLAIGDELGVGVSFRHDDKVFVEFDYTRSSWKNSGFSNTSGGVYDAFANVIDADNVFSSGVSHSFRLGAEYTPSRNDIRYYYKRISYRVGGYYNTSYYLFNGAPISSFGVTFGVTLPVFRGYNGLTLGVDIGQKGTLKNNGIRERYVGFNVGLNIFDIWFQRPRYE